MGRVFQRSPVLHLDPQESQADIYWWPNSAMTPGKLENVIYFLQKRDINNS